MSMLVHVSYWLRLKMKCNVVGKKYVGVYVRFCKFLTCENLVKMTEIFRLFPVGWVHRDEDLYIVVGSCFVLMAVENEMLSDRKRIF